MKSSNLGNFPFLSGFCQYACNRCWYHFVIFTFKVKIRSGHHLNGQPTVCTSIASEVHKSNQFGKGAKRKRLTFPLYLQIEIALCLKSGQTGALLSVDTIYILQ